MPGARAVRRGLVNHTAGASVNITVDPSLVEGAIADAVEGVEEQLEQLRIISQVEIELRGRHGGRVDVEPEGGFTAEQVGAPVIITLAPGRSPDDAEGAVLSFVGEILSTRKMRVYWSAANVAPSRVTINYTIGSL